MGSFGATALIGLYINMGEGFRRFGLHKLVNGQELVSMAGISAKAGRQTKIFPFDILEKAIARTQAGMTEKDHIVF